MLFILYCVEAGALLLVTPWSPIWARLLLRSAGPAALDVGLLPWVRASISAFGMVHLLWGAHDLLAWLSRRQLK